jgi:FKBP-type peptidyl-prolyl cis-trans isomerase FkpA
VKYGSMAGLLALSACVAVAACSKAPQDEGHDGGERAPVATAAEAPMDARQEASYMVGLDVARTLEPIKDEIDLDTVERAIRASLAGEKPRLDAAQLEAVRQRFTQHLRDKHAATQQALAETNRARGAAFFAENAGKPDVRTTASGLQYQVLREGKGARPGPADTVRVDYVSTLLDGTKIDSTYDIDHAATLALNRVMPGWSEGVQLMPLGSKYRLWVPAKLAYGEQGKPGEIEPEMPLVFEVELLEIAGKP